MAQGGNFGQIVKERRHDLGLTQTELGRRVGCAAITIRKIEADALRPSTQVAERLAVALNIPQAEHMAFVRLARAGHGPAPIPIPPPFPEEIGQEDLTGRAVRSYKLGERIGAGGYGAVYRARQTTIERDVAVKVILPTFANRPEFIRRFEAEAQLVARLEHPHVVPLYDYWREPGVAYLVMRLLRGGSLDQLVRLGPLPQDKILAVMEQIGSGLHTAHRAGIVHRDIKPANILLDENGNAYLADFGIAKVSGDSPSGEVTIEGTVIGSPAYLSPEQILAEPVKPQADIYSLGLVLYELLTGQKPFQGPTPVAFIQQHLNEPLPLLPQNGGASPPPTAAGQPIPTALDIVIGRATAKNPQDRYANLLTMLADLRLALSPNSTAADLARRQAGEVTPPHVAVMLELPDLENPYKGLRPFTEADTADFFGRTTLTQDLLARLAEAGDLARFLTVLGPSGSGKSSVVRAGLIPALRQGGIPGSDSWFITDMIPGQHPLEEMATALLRVAINPLDGLLAELGRDEQGLLRAVRRILPPDEQVELVLVVDQFEELFTMVEDEAVRTHLLNSLITAILDPNSRLRVIITLRADFTAYPLRYVDFGELVRQRTEYVLPLTPDELEEAIVGPTRRAGLSLEPGLVPAIIRDIGEHPSSLPLLQYALTELFERRKGRLLTIAGYRDSGGVLGALARRAEELYAGLDQADQELTRQLFLRLVTLGEGTEDTRRRVVRAELEALAMNPSPAEEAQARSSSSQQEAEAKTAMNAAIEQFGRYRLLTFDHDPVTRSPTVEVAHEALLREWRMLREWLDTSRADVRLQRLLAAAAHEWVETGQTEGYLLRGARLDQFEGWATHTALAFTGEERAFLEASLTARYVRRTEEAARQRREIETVQKLVETETRRATENALSARRLRWLAVGLALFLVVAVGAAWSAFNQSKVAQSNFETAERIRLAAQAQIALDNGEGGDLPALLALRSLQHGYSPEADAALLTALKRGFTRQRYLGHTGDLQLVDLSPDGRQVLTASSDRTARLWDAQTGQELRRFTGHTASVNAALFSPDGQYVLTGSHDNTARLWDTETGQELRQFGRHTGGVWGIDFSSDGQYVLTTDGTMARLWHRQTGQEVQRFVGHDGTLFWGDLSPDGRYLVTAGRDKSARLWDAQTGQELRQFLGHTDWLSGARFSPDGHYLLTMSADQTARLWGVQTGQEVRRFVGHTAGLFDGSFSPDGRYLVTAGFDKTVRLWDIASGREVRQFLGHTDFVSLALFSPDGQTILTGSGDRTARLWEVWPESEPQALTSSFFGGHGSDLYAVGVSSDRQLVLTGWTDGMVQVRDTPGGGVSQTINFNATTINALAISADDRRVLAGDSNGILLLGDVLTGQVVGRFEGHQGPIWDVAFSPDGAYALSGSEDRTARLWDLGRETDQEMVRFEEHQGPVRAVAFSPDGSYTVTGSDDNTARLWNTKTGQEIRQLAGHTAPVLDVAFSGDGRFILTGSADNSARLWETDTGREQQPFLGHGEQVSRVDLSPDGRYALTASTDQTARLWDVETGQTVRQFVGHSSPLLFAGFADDGRYIVTSDSQSVLLWRATLEEVNAFTCRQLSRDLTGEERALYNITDDSPTCAQFSRAAATAEPTWTPARPGSTPVSPLALSVEMEFQSEAVNITMGAPVQDAFIDAGNGQVVRPQVLDEETLAQPAYRTAVGVEPDFLTPPFDAGPYPKGEPLGFSLGDYVAAAGRGTYTVQGDRAVVEMSFEHLVPGGLYTFWCNTLFLSSGSMTENPCLAADSSPYSFSADEEGAAEVTMDIVAFPASTQDIVYEIAIAYHSDDRTHGYWVGEHGLNAHGQMFYDFVLPEDAPDSPPGPSLATEDSSAVAREWMDLLGERVQADIVPPPAAARIFAYAGVTLYEAVVPGLPDYRSLHGQLNDLLLLPQPVDGPHNWPAVAASAAAVVAKALFETPESQAAFDNLRDRQLEALQQGGLAADVLERSTDHGLELGQAIVVWLETDGYRELQGKSYAVPAGPGDWVPTSSRTRPMAPYWSELRPFALTAADACKPVDPVSYSKEPGSAFYGQAKEVYDASQTLTADERAIALFWADNPGHTATPPGHWVSIANQVAGEQQLPLGKTVELHALLGIGLADAFISCWEEKYAMPVIRPVSYIQQHIDPDWETLIPTPPFPEYTSGHSVASAAAAEILTAILGPMPFTDNTHASRGLGVRRFVSFNEAAEEAAISRLYGGIHYRMGIENGLTQGRCIGQVVLDRVQTH